MCLLGEDIDLPPDEVAQGLIDGSIDAAFMLSAIPSALVEELCERDAVRFLSLGDSQQRGNEADALALVFPSLTSGVIPRSTYVAPAGARLSPRSRSPRCSWSRVISRAAW